MNQPRPEEQLFYYVHPESDCAFVDVDGMYGDGLVVQIGAVAGEPSQEGFNAAMTAMGAAHDYVLQATRRRYAVVTDSPTGRRDEVLLVEPDLYVACTLDAYTADHALALTRGYDWWRGGKAYARLGEFSWANGRVTGIKWDAGEDTAPAPQPPT